MCVPKKNGKIRVECMGVYVVCGSEGWWYGIVCVVVILIEFIGDL